MTAEVIRELDEEIERLREQLASLQASSGYEAAIAQVEIERLRALASVVREQGIELTDMRAEIERLRAALHNIAIGGNGDRNWTLDEVRAVAWDALEPKP
jgi:dynactin complex subunit